LRLLIAGDSAAAGVGAASQSEALTGRLVARLQGSFRVHWRLEAKTGATTRETLSRLAVIEPPFDVLVTSLGVNDITRGVGTKAWLRSQRELRALALDHLGVRQLIVAGLPPVDRFPALPQPLRWCLGSRAKYLSGLLEKELEAEPSAHFVDLRFTLDAGLMASDGFHPGPAIYDGWAQRVAELVIGVHRA
jgi:lysophospholipase L1-like esterase